LEVERDVARRVAVTTRDGKVVQEHFGHARHFHIVEIEDGGYRYVETREIEPRCKGAFPDETPHDSTRFDPVIELLGDCDAVVTAQIGPGAAQHVIASGLRVFEGRGLVADILEEIVRGRLLDGGDDKPEEAKGVGTPSASTVPDKPEEA
jgi:predicted Fe-Mo cluster-binding NifX family protein